jgi:hypothetical protein
MQNEYDDDLDPELVPPGFHIDNEDGEFDDTIDDEILSPKKKVIDEDDLDFEDDPLLDHEEETELF